MITCWQCRLLMKTDPREASLDVAAEIVKHLTQCLSCDEYAQAQAAEMQFSLTDEERVQLKTDTRDVVKRFVREARERHEH